MNKNDLRTREWSKLTFREPQKVLIQLGELEKRFIGAKILERVLNLRTNKLKHVREFRAAALFCYGLGTKFLHATLYFAPYESSDYDCITMWIDGDIQRFAPLQIKEVVPLKYNPEASLNDVIAELNKYPCSKDLMVAIHVSKRMRLHFSDIKIPKLNIGELWVLGSSSADKSKWFLWGNALANPLFYEFDYPT